MHDSHIAMPVVPLIGAPHVAHRMLAAPAAVAVYGVYAIGASISMAAVVVVVCGVVLWGVLCEGVVGVVEGRRVQHCFLEGSFAPQ